MKRIVLVIFIFTFFGGFLSAQACCERSVIDELYLPDNYFTPTSAAIDTPDTNPNPCDSCRILVDMSDVELHGNNLDSLFAFLNRSFCEVVIDSTGISPEGFDVFCFPYKEDSISITRIREIQDYVYNGGTLVLLGECCGFSWTLNELLSDIEWETGLFINSDVILDSTDYLYTGGVEFPIFKRILLHPLIFGVDSVFLNRGGSIEISSPARRLAWGDYDAFSIFWNMYPGTTVVVDHEPTVLAINHFGEGIILLNSDISIWHRSGFALVYYEMGFNNRDLANNAFNCNIIPHFDFNPPKFSEVICFPETLDISVSIENYGMIESDSVRIEWESTVLTTVSPYVSVSDSILSFSFPLDSYSPGDTVNLCIEAVCDTGGYWPFDSICWWYYIDPFVDSLGPVIERITTDSLYPGDSLFVYVSDTSGIDTSSILFLMDLDTVETFSFEAGTLSIWGFPDTTASVSVIIIVEDLYPCWDNVGSASFTVDIRTGITETSMPRDFEVRAYPNPFNSSVTISISGECDSSLRIDIYDVNGRLVQPVTELVEVPGGFAMSEVANAKLPSTGSGSDLAPLHKGGQALEPVRGGSYVWTPHESLPSGVYLIRATSLQQTAGAVFTKWVVYLK